MAEKAPEGRGARALIHAACLVAPVVPIGITTGLEISRGWRPTSDDAAIAWRTFDVFSAHAPLVGAFNDATTSTVRPVFDVGPLQYYLLSVPDHLDPVHGLLWGAALVATVLVWIAVHAAWRCGGVVPAGAVAAGILVFEATQRTAMTNLPWNPNFGLFAFVTTLVLSVVVARGRLWWWPVGVFCGSLAAQSHLIFAPASVACLAAGLVVGVVALALAERRGASRGGEAADPHRERPSWPRAAWLSLTGGVVVAILTCLAPIVQQLTGHPGNLTLLFNRIGHQGRSVGIAFGLRAIGASAGVPPVWAHSAPPVQGHDWYLRLVKALFGGSPAAGVIILAAAGVVGIGALAGRRYGLAALALVATVGGIATAWTFGGIAASQVEVVTYADVVLWPVGMAIDAALLWAVVELTRPLVASAMDRRRADRASDPIERRQLFEGVRSGVATVALVPLLGWAIASLVPATSSNLAVIGGWRVANAIGPISTAIERTRPNRPVLVEPSVQLLPNGLPTWALTEGLAYELKVTGIDARLLPPMQPQLGPDAASTTHEITYLIEPLPNGRWKAVRAPRPRPVNVLSAVLANP